MLPDKVCPDIEAALRGLLHDGMTLLSGGFGLCGIPEALIEAVGRSGIKNLTVVSNNCGNQGQGLALLLKNRQVSTVICSYVGGNPDLADQYLTGAVSVELNPQGTFAERLRTAGAGLGGFFTPTGVGTIVAEGKETRLIDGRLHVFERPLRGELAIVRARVADRYGNLRFHRTARNFNPLMAMAATTAVAEVDELVPTGALDPDDVHLPGAFIARVVHVPVHQNVIESRTTRGVRPAAPASGGATA